MKKISFLGLAFCSALAMGLTSCSDDNNGSGDGSVVLTPQQKELQSILSEDIKNTIQPTYAALADSCSLLYDQIIDLRDAAKNGQVKQEDVDAACQTFLHARANYERSEAFLLGAAAHFGIDPHIDSWPLDVSQLANLLNSPKMTENLDFTKGDADSESAALNNAHNNFSQNLLGFHGIEFILFRDGAPRKASELNGKDSYYEQDNKGNVSNDLRDCTGADELRYAAAVAGDLKGSVICLNASWNKDANKEQVDWFDNLEWWGTTTDSGLSYYEYYVNAGQAGAATSISDAVTSFLTGDTGCMGISDEVGNTKINSPFSGSDVSYIESPYSKNSKTDFTNNIRSIENTWYGGIGVDEVKNAAGLTASNRGENSFHAYFAKNHPAEGKAVEDAIVEAKKAIQAINGNGAFVDYIKQYIANKSYEDGGKSGEAAMAACKKLSAALQAASDAIGK